MTNDNEENALFPEEGDSSAESDNEKSLEERVENLEDQVGYLRNSVMPEFRKVDTKNGVRYIAEFSVTNWYTPEELREKLNGGD